MKDTYTEYKYWCNVSDGLCKIMNELDKKAKEEGNENYAVIADEIEGLYEKIIKIQNEL